MVFYTFKAMIIAQDKTKRYLCRQLKNNNDIMSCILYTLNSITELKNLNTTADVQRCCV